MRRFTNNYAEDGKAVRQRAREAAGHRCIRCGHPYECGIKRPDKGEWSPCDEQCTHAFPVRIHAPGDLSWVELNKSLLVSVRDIVASGITVEAKWRILTVHHFDGDKSNDAWWNLLSLCQVCHLSFQSRVDPEIPWMFEHSDWLKPYVAAFYARKYEGREITREEAMARMDELLKYELRA